MYHNLPEDLSLILAQFHSVSHRQHSTLRNDYVWLQIH